MSPRGCSAGEGTDIERTCGLVRMYHQGKVCWILESEEQSFRANDGQPAPRRSVQVTLVRLRVELGEDEGMVREGVAGL